MKDLIEQNYYVTRKRGLITDETTIEEFINKIWEEFDELENECSYLRESQDFIYDFYEFGDKDFNIKKAYFEIADVILTCLNFARHLDIDIKQVLKEKIEINEKRI